jgi:hypothetical protein
VTRVGDEDGDDAEESELIELRSLGGGWWNFLLGGGAMMGLVGGEISACVPADIFASKAQVCGLGEVGS